MTVTIFIPSLIGGGAERVVSHLANGLASRHIDVDLVLVEATGPNLPECCRERACHRFAQAAHPCRRPASRPPLAPVRTLMC